MAAVLKRQVFETSRALEFFTEKELTMQIGHSSAMWPLALVKELIDNALDACEGAGIAPVVTVAVDQDSVAVADNGPGLPASVIERSLDYDIRVSDKGYYVSPTRGQLGNALKCVWAAPFVADGKRGRVEVSTGGMTHRIDVSLDRIAQEPRINRTVENDGLVKTGTIVKMFWPGVASYLLDPESCGSYKSLSMLLIEYSFFNPHASFVFGVVGDSDAGRTWAATDTGWHKWKPDNPTSPHWYGPKTLADLIARNLKNERDGSKRRTVREFVSEFAGLRATAKQRDITESVLLPQYLDGLESGGRLNDSLIARLWQAMCLESKAVKPSGLGVIGRESLTDSVYRFAEKMQYRKVEGEADGLPFVLEVAFGVLDNDNARRTVIVGLNWTPAIKSPMAELPMLLGQSRVDASDPVILVVHLACPRLDVTDRGKATLVLPSPIRAALARSVEAVTKEWKRAKLHDERVSGRRLREMRATKQQRLSIKDAAYQVMERAYMDASAGGTLPANARQIMYSARPLVLQLTGGRCWENSSSFTQQYLPDFLESNPQATAGWNVVFDARGRFVEPHTGHKVELGTLGVREYVGDWSDGIIDNPRVILDATCPTFGPANRYKFVLFVEKEGFNELWKAVDLARRYDVAIMSTKGMSVVAARQLVESLSEQGITTLVLRDFDKSGFSIVHTLSHNTRRFQFRVKPRVIDLGVRLTDVRELSLQSESVDYSGKVDPCINLLESGATAEEGAFLVRGRGASGWYGERVELNALGSARLVEWLEGKLLALGVSKIVPDESVLADAYRRAVKIARVQAVIDRAMKEEVARCEVPTDLRELVTADIQGTSLAWDDAVAHLAKERG